MANMFSNYLLTALRSLVKDKLFTLINIVGLATGLAATILISLFIQFETSFDEWIPNADRLFRMEATYHPIGREPVDVVGTSLMHRDALLNDFSSLISGVTRVARTFPTIQHGEDSFSMNVNHVDANFFDMFEFEFVRGDAELALGDNRSIVLTEESAGTLFGDADPLGQVVSVTTVQGVQDFRVSAVLKDLPDNTHFSVQTFILFDEGFWSFFPSALTSWINLNSLTYLELAPGVSPAELEFLMAAYADRHGIKPDVASYADVAPSDFVEIHMTNISDIHLSATETGDFQLHGSRLVLVAFAAVAVLLVAIGSINFINLSTARSERRAQEVALRKTLGATKGQLMAQFIGESWFLAMLSLVFALGVVWLVMPWYNQLLGRELSMAILFAPVGLLSILGLASAVGVASGIYPAIVMARVSPGRILRSNQSKGGGRGIFRMVLVTFQFAVSIALITSTIVLFRQGQFLGNLDLGYNSDNITVVRTGGSVLHDQAVQFANRLRQTPGIQSVGMSGPVPTDQAFGSVAVFSPMVQDGDSISVRPITVGFDFFETYDIPLVEGRLFSEEFQADIIPVYDFGVVGNFEGGVILNEAAVRRLGFENNQQAIGQVIRVSNGSGNSNTLTVVGVVRDFMFDSAHQPIQPHLMYYLPIFVGSLSIKYDPDRLEFVNAAIDDIWRDMFPESPLIQQSLDEMLAAQYQVENTQEQLLFAFSILTVLVACLGLFGLAAFMAQRRVKEVGIRKVLGASNSQIVSMFIKSFSWPVLVANLIAWPVAALAMSNWLERFTFRVDLDITPFVLASVLAAAFAAITVGGRVYRAARSSPIKALRSE